MRYGKLNYRLLSRFATNTRFNLGVVLLLLATASTTRGQDLVMQSLMPLPGHDECYAMCINELGQIAGNSLSGGTSEAVIWDRSNTATGLGTNGGISSRAYDINDLGQIVGSFVTQEGETHAFVWDAMNGMQDLGTLGDPANAPSPFLVYGVASKINNRGQVAGVSLTDENRVHGFFWDPVEGMIDIGTLGGDETRVTDLNNKGQIVGFSRHWQGAMTTFVWSQKDGMVGLPGGGKYQSFPHDINDKGEVVGRYWSEAFKSTVAYYWDSRAPYIWPMGLRRSPPLNVESWGLGINEKGLATGFQYVLDPFAPYPTFRMRPWGWIAEAAAGDGPLTESSQGYGIKINDLGSVQGVHWAETPVYSAWQSFVWREETGFESLGSIDRTNVFPFSNIAAHNYRIINNSDQAIGYSYNSRGRQRGYLVDSRLRSIFDNFGTWNLNQPVYAWYIILQSPGVAEFAIPFTPTTSDFKLASVDLPISHVRAGTDTAILVGIYESDGRQPTGDAIAVSVVDFSDLPTFASEIPVTNFSFTDGARLKQGREYWTVVQVIVADPGTNNPAFDWHWNTDHVDTGDWLFRIQPNEWTNNRGSVRPAMRVLGEPKLMKVK